MLARMRYWRDPTSQSPPSSGKFVTFTPDCGGFNNIRMGFEFAVLVAMVTRRTLVLPEPRPWYLIDFGPFTRMRPDAPRAGGVGRSSYGDFFNLTSLGSIVPLIDQDAFLSREAEQRPIPAAAPAAAAAGAKAQHAGVSQIMHGDLGHDNTWGYNRQACATKQSQGSDPEPNPIPNPPALTDRRASGSVVATPARAGRTGGSARATSSARARRTPGAAPAASAPRGCGLCCLSGSPLRSLGHVGAATFGASLDASCRQLTGDHWVPIATRVSEPGRRVRDWMEVGDSAGRQCMLHSTMRLPPDWATKTVRLKGHAFCCRGPDSGFGGVPASATKAAGFQGRVTTGVVRSNGSALSTPRLDDYVDLPWSPIDRYIAWPNVDAVEQSARADAHVRGAQRRATTAFPCHVHDTSATRPTGARKRRQARTSCKETSARAAFGASLQPTPLNRREAVEYDATLREARVLNLPSCKRAADGSYDMRYRYLGQMAFPAPNKLPKQIRHIFPPTTPPLSRRTRLSRRRGTQAAWRRASGRRCEAGGFAAQLYGVSSPSWPLCRRCGTGCATLTLCGRRRRTWLRKWALSASPRCTCAATSCSTRMSSRRRIRR